jgi:hypothetical protein
MSGIPLRTIGRITAGHEKGRFVEVIDDNASTGGFLIYTYANEARAPEVFDAWVETMEDVEKYFEESGWQVAWTV